MAYEIVPTAPEVVQMATTMASKASEITIPIALMLFGEAKRLPKARPKSCQRDRKTWFSCGKPWLWDQTWSWFGCLGFGYYFSFNFWGPVDGQWGSKPWPFRICSYFWKCFLAPCDPKWGCEGPACIWFRTRCNPEMCSTELCKFSNCIFCCVSATFATSKKSWTVCFLHSVVQILTRVQFLAWEWSLWDFLCQLGFRSSLRPPSCGTPILLTQYWSPRPYLGFFWGPFWHVKQQQKCPEGCQNKP